jgi:hybrid cluster-associated redox disulfide protein
LFALFAPAQRGNPQFGVFLWQMETKLILQPQTTVEEVLERFPNTYAVFMKRKTKCIGCFLQKFCTLQDVAETYQLSLTELLRDLEEQTQKSIITIKGESHENLIQSS